MSKPDFDVIIIGGGPAGSAAGIYLSRNGFRTAIIERKTFPRETLCGEFLSLEVIEQIRHFNLEKKFLALEPNRIKSFRFIPGNREFRSDLPFESFALKRSVFDEFLLKEAVSSGVYLFQPGEAKEVINEGERFTVRANTEGETKEISSRFLIGAFGKYNQLDKKLQRKHAEKKTGYYGIKFHVCKNELSNIDDSSVYLFVGNNIYLGINSVNREEAAICFLVKKDSKISPSDHLSQLFEENKQLSGIFNNNVPDLRQHEVYGAGSIYFGRKELIKNGIIMIGDAAKIIAPLAGDGIGMAFLSAKTASEIIKEAAETHIDTGYLERVYKAKWNKQFSGRTITASIVQSIILRNSYLKIIPDTLISRFIPILINATR